MAAQGFDFSNHVNQSCVRVHGAARSLAGKLESFRGDRSGATAIEYGLLAAGISVVIIATVFTLGETLLGTFQNVVDTLQNGGGGGGG